MSPTLYNFRPFEMIKENYDESFLPGQRSGERENNFNSHVDNLINFLYPLRTPYLL